MKTSADLFNTFGLTETAIDVPKGTPVKIPGTNCNNVWVKIINCGSTRAETRVVFRAQDPCFKDDCKLCNSYKLIHYPKYGKGMFLSLHVDQPVSVEGKKVELPNSQRRYNPTRAMAAKSGPIVYRNPEDDK